MVSTLASQVGNAGSNPAGATKNKNTKKLIFGVLFYYYFVISLLNPVLYERL